MNPLVTAVALRFGFNIVKRGARRSPRQSTSRPVRGPKDGYAEKTTENEFHR
jgi:hypothetical protein